MGRSVPLHTCPWRLPLSLLQSHLLGWSNGSVVKSAGSFCRGPFLCAWVKAHTLFPWRPEDIPSCDFQLLFESLELPYIGQASWPLSSSTSVHLHLPPGDVMAGITDVCHCTWLFTCGSWGSKLTPHNCQATSLLTDLSSQPDFFIYLILFLVVVAFKIFYSFTYF